MTLELTKVNQKTSEFTSPLPSLFSIKYTTELERTIVPVTVTTNVIYFRSRRPKKQVMSPPMVPSTAIGNWSCYMKNQ